MCKEVDQLVELSGPRTEARDSETGVVGSTCF